jgi:hypothetical protein
VAPILLDGLRYEQAPAFRRQRQAFAHDRIGGLSRDGLTAPFDKPARRANKAGDGRERRRLAGAVGPEQRHDLSSFDLQRNIGDADKVAVAHFQMVDSQLGHLVALYCLWRPR